MYGCDKENNILKNRKRVHFTNSNVAWGATALIVICLSILFYLFLTKLPSVSLGLKSIIKVLMPVIIGAAMAYILLPVYNALLVRLQKLFLRIMSPVYAGRTAKGVSTLLSLSLLLVTMTVMLIMAVPQVVDSLVNIANSMPANIGRLTDLTQKLLRDNPKIYDMVVDWLNQFEGGVMSMIKQYLLPFTNELLSSVTTGVINVLSFMLNVVIGLIVCVYILVSKETFCAQGKKFIYGRFETEPANRFIEDMRVIHRIFSGFISGKILDSFIIGVITMIALSIMNIPYAVMISIIVGVTNIIPFFGPFIGAVPSALIILTVSPVKSLYFIIYVFIIQQIDGNILGPKILGNSTGLPSFWVLFAILLCGGLFGVAGMILGVPVFAAIYFFAGRWINESLQRRGFDSDTRLYYGLHDAHQEDGTAAMNYNAGITYEPQRKGEKKKAGSLKNIITNIAGKKNHQGKSEDENNSNDSDETDK